MTSPATNADAADHLTWDGLYSYTWNGEGLLSSAAGVTYTYDGDLRRVAKSNGTPYWYCATCGRVLAESDLSGNIASEYTYFDDQRIARRDVASGNVCYLFSAWLGSYRTVTDSSGNVKGESDYYRFGGERVTSSTVTDSFRFGGMEWDPEDGLNHTLYRKFSPALGRWEAPDPVRGDPSNPQSWNQYAYVINNPTSFVDPLGLGPGDQMDCTVEEEEKVVIHCEPVPPEGASQSPPPEEPTYAFFVEVDAYTSADFYTPSIGTPDLTDLPNGGSRGGAGNIVGWPVLRPLVHQNNLSSQCDELVDCIVFNESHVGSSLSLGFNANAVSGYGARGLMQMEPIALKDVLTNGGSYPVPAATVNQVWSQMFNPALNIQAGSGELQIDIDRAKGNVLKGVTKYGPPSGSPNYANDILNCVQKLQSGDVAGAFAAATAHN